MDAPAAATGGAEIYRLPEECVAYAISLTTPGDACHSSAVSPAFRAAADSDAVWDRFLPPDHAAVLARADEPVECESKKELFSRLCDSPVLLDGATMVRTHCFKNLIYLFCSGIHIAVSIERSIMYRRMKLVDDTCMQSFGLERRSGAKCFMMSARALSIVWGDDPTCWVWTASLPGSRWVPHACFLFPLAQLPLALGCFQQCASADTQKSLFAHRAL